MAKIKIALTRLNVRVEMSLKKKQKSKQITKKSLRLSRRDTITSKNKMLQYRKIGTPRYIYTNARVLQTYKKGQSRVCSNAAMQLLWKFISILDSICEENKNSYK